MTKIIICCGTCGRGNFRPHKKKKARIVFALGAILEQAGPAAKTPRFQGEARDRKDLIMAFQMTSSQQTTVTAKFVDKKGNPAKVDGAPTWSTDNTDVLALKPSDDGLSCVVAAVDPLGVAGVTMRADADLGAGVVELIGTLEVEITAGQATTVKLEAAPPTEQPEPAPV